MAVLVQQFGLPARASSQLISGSIGRHHQPRFGGGRRCRRVARSRARHRRRFLERRWIGPSPTCLPSCCIRHLMNPHFSLMACENGYPAYGGYQVQPEASFPEPALGRRRAGVEGDERTEAAVEGRRPSLAHGKYAPELPPGGGRGSTRSGCIEESHHPRREGAGSRVDSALDALPE